LFTWTHFEFFEGRIVVIVHAASFGFLFDHMHLKKAIKLGMERKSIYSSLFLVVYFTERATPLFAENRDKRKASYSKDDL